MEVLYFVHDLHDPAVRRRVLMLEAGGATVTLAGFQRGNAKVPGAISLGATRDGAFGQRIAAVGRACGSIGHQLRGLAKPDIIIARNLEMLAVAKRARAALGAADVPIVYECLDIHRLLLRDDPVGSGLRQMERFLARDVDLLVTSSPAFIDNYFQLYGQLDAPTLLLENKLLDLNSSSSQAKAPVQAALPGRPWKIGWFGALRCRRSLDHLAAVSRVFDGQLNIVLRGRPALREFDDFHGFVDREPFMSFEGPYRNPEDIEAIYTDVHFAWAVDFFEDGQNSKWLLPNRLYEGCRYGAVPIAMRDTQVGKYLEERKLGVLLDEVSVAHTTEALTVQMANAFDSQRARLMDVDHSQWVCSQHDCKSLVDRLEQLVTQRRRQTTQIALERAA